MHMNHTVYDPNSMAGVQMSSNVGDAGVVGRNNMTTNQQHLQHTSQQQQPLRINTQQGNGAPYQSSGSSVSGGGVMSGHIGMYQHNPTTTASNNNMVQQQQDYHHQQHVYQQHSQYTSPATGLSQQQHMGSGGSSAHHRGSGMKQHGSGGGGSSRMAASIPHNNPAASSMQQPQYHTTANNNHHQYQPQNTNQQYHQQPLQYNTNQQQQPYQQTHSSTRSGKKSSAQQQPFTVKSVLKPGARNDEASSSLSSSNSANPSSSSSPLPKSHIDNNTNKSTSGDDHGNDGNVTATTATSGGSGGDVSASNADGNIASNTSQHLQQSSSNDSNNSSSTANNNKANNSSSSNNGDNKDKTSMCLINELSFYNKIRHEYTLTSETGPAHEKHFEVTLQLGTESYKGTGPSIKKSQHAAAAEALKHTAYMHPPPRSQRKHPIRSRGDFGFGSGRRGKGSGSSAGGFYTTNPMAELSALATQSGESTRYETIEPHRALPAPPPHYYAAMHHHHYDYRGMYHQRYHGPYNYGQIIYVSLHIGQKEFIGTGYSQLGARQNAAAKALQVLGRQAMSMKKNKQDAQESQRDATSATTTTVNPTDGSGDNSAGGDNATTDGDNITSAPSEDATDDTTATGTSGTDDIKSEVSQVYEIAFRRKMTVKFEVTDEFGLAHNKSFVTQCTVGHLTSSGTGSKKKSSKQNAAKNMLTQLAELQPPLPPQRHRHPAPHTSSGDAGGAPPMYVPGGLRGRGGRGAIRGVIYNPHQLPQYSVHPHTRYGGSRKKNKVIRKDTGTLDGSGVNTETGGNGSAGDSSPMHPVSRLIHIQQAMKDKDPVYTLVNDPNHIARPHQPKKFIMQVETPSGKATGIGPNKKEAKRSAAQALLELLGYSKPSSANEDGAAPQHHGDGKKGSFIDHDSSTSRQVVPGVLLMPDSSGSHSSITTWNSNYTSSQQQQNQQQQPVSQVHHAAMSTFTHQASGQTPVATPHTVAAMAKELLETGSSPTAESFIVSTNSTAPVKPASTSPRDLLQYLATTIGHTVSYTDFPKGAKNKFLALVTLSTNPQHVSHGDGASVEESHDNAAASALNSLANMNLSPASTAAGSVGARGSGDATSTHRGDALQHNGTATHNDGGATAGDSDIAIAAGEQGPSSGGGGGKSKKLSTGKVKQHTKQ